MRARLGSLFRPAAAPVPTPVGGTLLAPLGGAAHAHLDAVGNVSIIGHWPQLRWSVRTGDGWLDPNATRGVKQSLVGAAAVETSLPASGGVVVHRCAVGVVGGVPAAVIEIENRSDYAIAIGLDLIDPSAATTESGPDAPSLGARIGTTDASLLLDGELFAVLGTAPRPTPVVEEQDEMDEPPVVFALPHTAVLQITVPMTSTDVNFASAAVPGPSDINRGWQRHLESAFRIDVGDESLEAAIVPLQRAVLSVGPGTTEAWRWAVALCESGYASELDLTIDQLGDESPADLIFAVGRWAELGGDLAQAERILEPIARSAVTLRKANHQVIVPMGWSVGMLAGAVRAMQAIEQPDVGDEIAALTNLDVRRRPLATIADIRADLSTASATYSWPDSPDADRAAHVLRSIRYLMVDESGASVDLLAELPVAWRGRPIEAHNFVVAAGRLSYGLRWHGPRPALLWELERTTEAPFELRVSSIDPEWASIDEAGEHLLADPGWPTP